MEALETSCLLSYGVPLFMLRQQGFLLSCACWLLGLWDALATEVTIYAI